MRRMTIAMTKKNLRERGRSVSDNINISISFISIFDHIIVSFIKHCIYMYFRSRAAGGFWSSLTSLVGNKTLTRSDIEPVIAKMQDHLISKNVAADVAVKLCDSVANNLEGKVLGTFSSIHRSVKETLTESLMKLLTPKRRIDIIRDVIEAKANKKPYVITFCGVNGVGKSTNLAKICFWLVENKCRVLIAACDTFRYEISLTFSPYQILAYVVAHDVPLFRAGAVEQLRTHTRRLNNLHPAPNGGKPFVELYEKGYGKDAAGKRPNYPSIRSTG